MLSYLQSSSQTLRFKPAVLPPSFKTTFILLLSHLFLFLVKHNNYLLGMKEELGTVLIEDDFGLPQHRRFPQLRPSKNVKTFTERFQVVVSIHKNHSRKYFQDYIILFTL